MRKAFVDPDFPIQRAFAVFIISHLTFTAGKIVFVNCVLFIHYAKEHEATQANIR